GRTGRTKKTGVSYSLQELINLYRFFLYELDLVTVRIFHESNDSGTMLHGPRLTRNPAATLFHFLAGLIGIVHFYGDMSVARTKVIFFNVPVVGQLQYGAIRLILITDKRQRELPLGIILAA